MSRRAVVITLTAAVACAPLLGGLDEGTGRPFEDASVDRTEAMPACTSLADYTYRIPIHIEHHGPAIRGYQTKLVFSSKDLVTNGHMRADGGDIAITLADGTTRVPHWLQGGVGTDTTTLWARFDLGDSPIDAWLYYGSPTATDHSSAEDTFVEAAIANPNFDRDGGWTPYTDHLGPSTSSHQWAIAIADGKATLYFSTDPHPNGYALGLCAEMNLPNGEFRLLFDFQLLIAERGQACITTLSDVTPILWSTETENIVAPAQRMNVETQTFTPTGALICLTGLGNGSADSTSLKATFTALRFRRWLDGDRIAMVSGAEERACVH